MIAAVLFLLWSPVGAGPALADTGGTAFSADSGPPALAAVPAAPSGVVATAVNASQIRVTWTDASDDEAGFRVSDGFGTVPVGANATSYVWGGLFPGTLKCFTVQSFNIAGPSPGATQVCGATQGARG